jgi:hypothetical protein
MAIAKAVPEMSSGRIFTEWKSMRPEKLSYAAVIETKNAQLVLKPKMTRCALTPGGPTSGLAQISPLKLPNCF